MSLYRRMSFRLKFFVWDFCVSVFCVSWPHACRLVGLYVQILLAVIIRIQ